MNMPGFTAEVSLNELGGHYAMTTKDAFSGSGLVIGQQLSAGVVPNPSYISLENCSPCIRYSDSRVTCDVIKVNPALASRTYLGQVSLPQNCSDCWERCIL